MTPHLTPHIPPLQVYAVSKLRRFLRMVNFMMEDGTHRDATRTQRTAKRTATAPPPHPPLLPPSTAVVSMAESSLKSHAAFIVDRAAYDVTVRATDDVEVVPKGAPSLYPPLFTLELTVNVGVEGVDDGIAYKVWRL